MNEIIPLFTEALPGEIVVSKRPIGGHATPMDRMREWAEAYSLWRASLRSDNTRRAYEKAWKDLLSYTEKMFWQIQRQDVASWVEGMKNAGLSDCTLQQRVAAISSFYQYSMSEYEVELSDGRMVPLHDYNPAASKSLRPKVQPYGKAIHLSMEEVRALLSSIKRNTVIGLRDFALILTYLATGRRNTEARSLKFGDIETNGGRVWYRWSGKGKKDERFEMPPEVWEAIKTWLKEAGRLETMQEDDYLFTATTDRASRLPNNRNRGIKPFSQPISMREVNRLLKKYCRKAGLDPKKVHVHTLRHTAAMARKEAGDDIEKISEFLAHSSVAITQIYVHRVQGKKDESWTKVAALWGL